MIGSFSDSFGPITAALLMLLLSISVISDLHGRRIPNVLVVSGLLGGSALAVTSGLSVFFLGVAGFLVSLAVLFPVYLAGWLGAGDVKLLSVVGAFLGVEQLLSAWVFIALAGGGLSLLYLYLSRLGWVDARVPYAVAILIGVVAHLIFYFD